VQSKYTVELHEREDGLLVLFDIGTAEDEWNLESKAECKMLIERIKDAIRDRCCDE